MQTPTLIGRQFRVLREIGRGGMGVVYQVIQVQTGKQYALKVLSVHASTKPDTLSRFKREIKMPSHIESQHIVKVFESDTAEELDGAPFYVMELLYGCDVRRLIEKKRSLSRPDIAWLCWQIASCLDSAHKVGIVHRDLKPDNIFLHQPAAGGLTTKILDFGIARINQELLESKDRANLTATQAMLGTPLYMSPEQAMGGEGRHLIGPATDVWALGLIVFELLVGRSYWAADSLLQHLGQLLFAPLPPPSQKATGLPKGFDDWFSRSCARAAGERFQSVGEQVALLGRILGVEASGKASLDLTNYVSQEAPPLIDHAEVTFSNRNEWQLQQTDPQSGLQPLEVRPRTLSALGETDEAATVRFNRLSEAMLPGGGVRGAAAISSGVPQELADPAATVPTSAPPLHGSPSPQVPRLVSGAMATLITPSPGPQRKSLPPPTAPSSVPELVVEPMPTVPFQTAPKSKTTGSPSQPNLLSSADQDVKAELLGNGPAAAPVERMTTSVSPVMFVASAGVFLLGIILWEVLSTSSTPVPQPRPDLASPIQDLSTPPDLSTFDLAPPQAPKGKKGPKQPQPPGKKDKSSLKFYVPPSL